MSDNTTPLSLIEWAEEAKAALEYAKLEMGKRGRPDPVDDALASYPLPEDDELNTRNGRLKHE